MYSKLQFYLYYNIFSGIENCGLDQSFSQPPSLLFSSLRASHLPLFSSLFIPTTPIAVVLVVTSDLNINCIGETRTILQCRTCEQYVSCFLRDFL
jgi:hypothetical protein